MPGAGGASGDAAIAQGGSLGGRSGSANGNETDGGAPGAGGTSSGTGGSIGDSGDLPPLPDPGPGPLYLPCDVARALSVCRNCHSNPPIHDTQYSLVTYADVAPLAPAIYDDIVSGNMPRPPFLLAPAAKAALLDWLGEHGSAALGVTAACE